MNELKLEELEQLLEEEKISKEERNGITKYTCDAKKIKVREFLKPLESFKIFNCYEEFEIFTNKNGEVLAIAVCSEYKRYCIHTSAGPFHRTYENYFLNLTITDFTEKYISVIVNNKFKTVKKLRLSEPLAIIK